MYERIVDGEMEVTRPASLPESTSLLLSQLVNQHQSIIDTNKQIVDLILTSIPAQKSAVEMPVDP